MPRSRRLRPDMLESLEGRLALSGVGVILPPTTNPPAIQGVVIDSRTGQGVGAVKIQLVNYAAKVIRTTRTDQFGLYNFQGLSGDLYVVRESNQRTAVPDSTFLNGVPVGTNDINFVTGDPYPPVAVRYASNHTVFSAEATGPHFPFGQKVPYMKSAAEKFFEFRANDERQYIAFTNSINAHSIFDVSYVGGRTLLGGAALLL